MITLNQLENFKNTPANLINKENLADIQSISLNTDQAINQRFEKYINEIKNPYCFLCGQTTVKIEFADNGKSLDEFLSDYLINLKNK